GHERCRACARVLGPDEVLPVVEEPIPLALPAEPGPDIPDALPVGPGDGAGPARGTAPAVAGLSSHQQKFFLYLANTVEQGRAALTWWSLTRDYLRLPVQMLIVGAGLYVAVLALHVALDWLAQYVGARARYAMYLVPVLPVLFGGVMRWYMEEQPVALSESEARFLLGGFSSIFDSMTQAVFGCFLLAVFFSQLAVLTWTPNHGGLNLTGDVWESARVCADTLLRSFFLDPAWFGWQLGPAVEHGGLSTPL